MTGTLEIVSVALFVATGLAVLSCALLAGWSDRLMSAQFPDSKFEEA
ncbi:MAG TPA: hypothetical protein VK815_12355 [Candidatus Acidoferrales bacterium]|jgi:hypothetical protein|nr:hypothetical protein [Candidatus Acidoferrales bacterium]